MNKLNPSIKHHVFIGLLISLWVFVFTFYIKPFDGASYTPYWWWQFLSIGFSLISFLCYFFITMFQNSVYQKILKWNIALEISFILLFHFLNLIFIYLFYKSPFLKGILSFNDFSNVFLKAALIFTPIIIFARNYIVIFLNKEEIKVDKKEDRKEDDFLIIKGEYKLDLLKILKSDLICVSKSQNYIEIFFIENNHIKSKLIRSSLKKTQEDLTFLIQVHRSHLINPQHFKSWKNKNVISLTQIEIPVSKNYKNNLMYL